MHLAYVSGPPQPHPHTTTITDSLNIMMRWNLYISCSSDFLSQHRGAIVQKCHSDCQGFNVTFAALFLSSLPLVKLNHMINLVEGGG